jgi:hypothetical protein
MCAGVTEEKNCTPGRHSRGILQVCRSIPTDKLIMRTKNASRLQAGLRTVECDLLLTYRSYVGLWPLSEECLIFRTFRELAARRQVVVTDRHVVM